MNIKEVAKMFEKSGVARTERSIINWCYPNKQGISRLDCFYDNNERKWLITPQSVDLAIKEEIARVKTKDRSNAGGVLNTSEEGVLNDSPDNKGQDEVIKKLEDKNFHLTIDNKFKEKVVDHLKEQIKTDRAIYMEKIEAYKNELVSLSKQVGILQTRLLLLEGGSKDKMQSEEGFRSE